MPAVATAVILASLAVIGVGAGGFALGRSTGPDYSDALEAQASTLAAQGDALERVAEAAGRPVVIDAEVRATLAEVPAQCRRDMGGDPLGVACQWATCLQYGQSAAQRPECRAVEAAMIAALPGCTPQEDAAPSRGTL
jgi:hypothetical protein